MAVISVITDAEDQYKGVEIYFINEDEQTEEVSFCSCDFIKDYYDGVKFWLNEVRDIDKISNEWLRKSSSVNNYIYENKHKFKIGYVDFDLNDPIIYYVSDDLSYTEKSKLWDLFEIVIPSNETWSWNQYRDYCNW